jgi:hypothetical protein
VPVADRCKPLITYRLQAEEDIRFSVVDVSILSVVDVRGKFCTCALCFRDPFDVFQIIACCSLRTAHVECFYCV